MPHLHSDSPSWPDDLREEVALVRYLAPVEIAYITGFHQRTVLSWLSSGKLEGTKISGHWRVHPDKLKTFIESGYSSSKEKK